MIDPLYSTCRLEDCYHWLLLRPNGHIVAASTDGFLSMEEALRNLGIPPKV